MTTQMEFMCCTLNGCAGELTQSRVRGTTYTKLPHRAITLCALVTAILRPNIKNAGREAARKPKSAPPRP